MLDSSVPPNTPLCPAGHLPLKGGDQQEASPSHKGISPSPTPPHKGEGLRVPHPQHLNFNETGQRFLSPLVGRAIAYGRERR